MMNNISILRNSFIITAILTITISTSISAMEFTPFVNEEASQESENLILQKAANWGNLDFIKFVITKRLQANPQTKIPPIILHQAAQNGYGSIVEFIIDKLLEQNPQVDINPCLDSYTLLHRAAANNQVAVLKIIINKMLKQNPNANINLCIDGFTPILIAKISGAQDAVFYLQQQQQAVKSYFELVIE